MIQVPSGYLHSDLDCTASFIFPLRVPTPSKSSAADIPADIDIGIQQPCRCYGKDV